MKHFFIWGIHRYLHFFAGKKHMTWSAKNTIVGGLKNWFESHSQLKVLLAQTRT
jgi:hypothetical protein